MADRPKAVALDVDPDSLITLHRAFPDWEAQRPHEWQDDGGEA